MASSQSMCAAPLAAESVQLTRRQCPHGQCLRTAVAARFRRSAAPTDFLPRQPIRSVRKEETAAC
eukprot:4450628-Pleurochrysis_carterae.AAC.6